VSKDGKMLDSNLIEREIHHLVIKDHAVKIQTLDAEIFKAYGAHISYYKLWDENKRQLPGYMGIELSLMRSYRNSWPQYKMLIQIH
jgi:hypothetical protein